MCAAPPDGGAAHTILEMVNREKWWKSPWNFFCESGAIKKNCWR